jgi:hypothetical protein
MVFAMEKTPVMAMVNALTVSCHIKLSVAQLRMIVISQKFAMVDLDNVLQIPSSPKGPHVQAASQLVVDAIQQIHVMVLGNVWIISTLTLSSAVLVKVSVMSLKSVMANQAPVRLIHLKLQEPYVQDFSMADYVIPTMYVMQMVYALTSLSLQIQCAAVLPMIVMFPNTVMVSKAAAL